MSCCQRGKSWIVHVSRGRGAIRQAAPYTPRALELDSLGMSVNALERNGFEVHDVEGWREHYQQTCAHWAQRLYEARERAAAEAGWEKTRLWLIYLAGCSLAFERSSVGIFQTLASKRDKGPSGLPPTRADLYS